MQEASEQPGITEQPESAIAHGTPSGHGAAPGMGGLLADGFRLLTLRRVDRPAAVCGPDRWIGLAAIMVLLSIAASWLNHQPASAFNAWALLAEATLLLLLLLAAYLFASRGTGEVGDTGRFVVQMLALGIAVLVLHTAAYWLARGVMLLWPVPRAVFLVTWLVIGWSLLSAVVAILRLAGPRPTARRLGVLLYLGIYFLPGWWLVDWVGGYWYSDPDAGADAYAAYRDLDVESIYYRQPQLLQAQVAGLEAERPGVTDLYFAGFGSYAQQDVFLREVTYIRDLFDRRFGTRGRSALLVNNLQTLERLPLANRHNLGALLQAMSRRMNTDEDVLFLYLTSHGGPDGSLAVDFWPLGLNDLNPQWLRSELDAAGIRWRMIVVSACYSGTYLEPLRDDHTLVLTAAARDRQSFGCSHTRNFTYFGEALFHDTLSVQSDFREAITRPSSPSPSASGVRGRPRRSPSCSSARRCSAS